MQRAGAPTEVLSRQDPHGGVDRSESYAPVPECFIRRRTLPLAARGSRRARAGAGRRSGAGAGAGAEAGQTSFARVKPTGHGRKQHAFTRSRRLDVCNAQNIDDDAPLDAACGPHHRRRRADSPRSRSRSRSRLLHPTADAPTRRSPIAARQGRCEHTVGSGGQVLQGATEHGAPAHVRPQRILKNNPQVLSRQDPP